VRRSDDGARGVGGQAGDPQVHTVLIGPEPGRSSYGVVSPHTPAHGDAVVLRMPPRFQAQAAIEQWMVESRDIAGGKDIGQTGWPNSSTTMPPSSASPAASAVPDPLYAHAGNHHRRQIASHRGT
jgi:hypothetical protein